LKNQKPLLEDRARRSIDLIALLAFCGFFFLAGIQLVGLIGADEPRYAQVAREMLARHDWVTPVLYGHPWLEKPPLYYWCAMLAYKGAGGVSDWAARLPSSLLCSLMVFFIYLWVRHFRRGMQLDAALITASSAMVIGFGRSASTDMPLTTMFTAAMLCWYGWYSSQDRGWQVGFYLFLGLGTLAKGPVAALLAGLIIVAFAAIRRDGRLLLRTLWPAGIVLYLAIILPWFVAVQRANPEFFRVFFLQQNLARYTTDLYRHYQPFWYFLPVALLALVPWTVFVIAALVDAIRDWQFSAQQPPGTEDLRLFLTLWLLLPILFFSPSQSKLPGYILPAVPAGAILLADFILRLEEAGEKPGPWLALAHALLCAAMPAAAFVIPFKLAKQEFTLGNITVVAALAIACVLSLWLSLHNYGYRVLRFVTLVPAIIAFALTLKGTGPRIDMLQSAHPVQAAIARHQPEWYEDACGMSQSARPLHATIARLADPPTVIAVYDVPRSLEYGLAFYRNQPIPSYERNEIPDVDHVVVAASGNQRELEHRLPKRLVVLVGGFACQHLDFYLVSGKPSSPALP
jgi:4-amino-4-deoxy-L-arabinose transferase-like glycosyltransferase